MKSGCKKGEKEKTVTETQKNTTVFIKRQWYFLFALLNIYNLIACIGDSLYQCFIADILRQLYLCGLALQRNGCLYAVHIVQHLVHSACAVTAHHTFDFQYLFHFYVLLIWNVFLVFLLYHLRRFFGGMCLMGGGKQP